MKRIILILALAFGALCVIFGMCYACLCIMDIAKKFRDAKKATIQKLKDYVLDD